MSTQSTKVKNNANGLKLTDEHKQLNHDHHHSTNANTNNLVVREEREILSEVPSAEIDLNDTENMKLYNGIVRYIQVLGYFFGSDVRYVHERSDFRHISTRF